MASLLSRFVASFDAIKPVPNLTGLDGEFDQLEGASGVLNGGTTGKKLLIKTSDATDPPVDCDQISTGFLGRWKQNGSVKANIANNGDLNTNGIATSSGVVTFGSIPLGPASNPTADNELARKLYVDTRKNGWALNWFIQDPSTFPLNSFSQAQKAIVPLSGVHTAVDASVIYSSGTASGSFTIDIRKHTFADQTAQTVLATLAINPGSGVGVGNFFQFADAALSEGEYLFIVLTARSSPLQRDVTISLRGFQTPTS